MTNYTTLTFPKEMTIDSFLRDTVGLGKKKVHTLRMQRAASILDEVIPFEHHVPQGTDVTFRWEERSDYIPKTAPLRIGYEDEHFFIVWKPSGMKTHPNDPKETNTLINFVTGHTGGPYVEHVHRLDEATAGWVLVAKHPFAKAALDQQLEKQQIRRFYEATISGKMPRPTGTFNGAIGKDRHDNTKRVVVSSGGQQAKTSYRVLSYDRATKTSKVELELHTGRTHQIRVHLAHARRPIVGDPLYHPHPTGTFDLRATRLQLQHPFTQRQLDVCFSENE